MVLAWIAGIATVISLAATVANIIMAALYKPPEPPIPSPKDVSNVPTAEQGNPVPVLFGTRWITQPNVVHWGNPRSEPNRVDPSELV